MKNPMYYSQRDILGQSLKKDPFESQKTIKLEPAVKMALIDVAGTFAIEINKSNPNLTTDDLVKSFRDAYSSLSVIFLMPET